jgi:hypothetical protein
MAAAATAIDIISGDFINTDFERSLLINFLSHAGPVTYDSVSETSLLYQYISDRSSSYALSAAEFSQAQAYVDTFGERVLGPVIRTRADGLVERNVMFGIYAPSAPLLDGLLGTATGVLGPTGLVGIRDNFNFDRKDRGDYPFGSLANAGVNLIRFSNSLCGGTNGASIPVTGGVQ